METVKKIQTHEHIAQMIRTAIFAGDYRNGEELVQEKLAEKLQLSRTPVREALRILEQEGIVRRLPNRHVQVSGVSTEEVHSVFFMMARMGFDSALLCWRKNREDENLRTAYDAYRDAVASEKKNEIAEKAFAVLMQFAEMEGTHYLIQLYRRLLSGYGAYALHLDRAHSKENILFLSGCVEAFYRQDRQDLSHHLEDYFNQLADIMVRSMNT